MSQYFDTNRNARISSRIDRTGKTRTETQRRDPGAVQFAVSTDTSSNSTNLFIDVNHFEQVQLTGREARSLYRLLRKHYKNTDKSLKG